MKNKAAVELGKLGGKARAANQTKAERSQSARDAAIKRWSEHVYSDNASAKSQRKRRAGKC